MEWQILVLNSKDTCFCNILRNYEKVGGDRGKKKKRNYHISKFALSSRDRSKIRHGLPEYQ